ncbi:hypothetical protein GCM10010435_46440 [Winogradskya consettensis]|uniref:Uncharacterized protein n=1 Tax=Winogradskya consettensis TaxID=113560 RepID=A0A919VYL4_9ACTN|nr:hypothetical protein [Actinoplanes consettensis]GIM83077.1 hypothetical protein Aco04nite_84820 [Actinoplanes consettensis]
MVHLRRVLRTLLNQAITDGHLTQNAAKKVKLPSTRVKKRRAWTSDKARLRKGEMPGTTWDRIDLGVGEIMVDLQLQRVGHELLHRETKIPNSDDALPFPDVYSVALQKRAVAQKAAKEAAGDAWHLSELVFTTRFGTPIEPRNFNRCGGPAV